MSPVIEAYSIAHPYYLMYKSAELSLVHASKNQEHQALNLVNAYVMIAFTLEAYVNDFCAVCIPAALWDDIERKLGTLEKLKLVSACLQIPLDFSVEPFQHVKTIFKIRDRFAHCKRNVQHVSDKDLSASPLPMPKVEFQEFLSNITLARKLYGAVYEMVTYLHSVRTHKDNENHPLESGPASHFMTIMLEQKTNTSGD